MNRSATKAIGALDMKWDTTPAPGATVDDLGHGVTVVLRNPPPPRAGLPAGRIWIAPYALNCAEHGWRVSRRTAEECAAEGREHIARDHGPEACAKCGYPVMRSWGGYGHAPGYSGKRHVVTVAQA